MTEDPIDNQDQAPADKPAQPKPPAKKPMFAKPAGNPFLGKAGNFNKSKVGNPGFKGKVFKSSGVKKGK